VGLVHVHLPPRPVGAARARAYRRAGALCGAAEGLAVALRLPHGYWIVLTSRRCCARSHGSQPGAQSSGWPARCSACCSHPSRPVPAAGSADHHRRRLRRRLSVVPVRWSVHPADGADDHRHRDPGLRRRPGRCLAVGELRLAWTIVGAAVAATAAASCGGSSATGLRDAAAALATAAAQDRCCSPGPLPPPGTAAGCRAGSWSPRREAPGFGTWRPVRRNRGETKPAQNRAMTSRWLRIGCDFRYRPRLTRR